MSDSDPHTIDTCTTDLDATIVGPILEHAKRIRDKHREMVTQLQGLSLPWRVISPGRIERWSVGAIVLGPPAIFLVWPIAGAAERHLWRSAQMCRQFLHDQLGPEFRGAVEVVFAQPIAERENRVRRVITPGIPGILPATNVVFFDGSDLAGALAQWETLGGALPIAPRSLIRMWRASARRWERRGPHPLADQLPVLDDPVDWRSRVA